MEITRLELATNPNLPDGIIPVTALDLLSGGVYAIYDLRAPNPSLPHSFIDASGEMTFTEGGTTRAKVERWRAGGHHADRVRTTLPLDVYGVEQFIRPRLHWSTVWGVGHVPEQPSLPPVRPDIL